MQLPCREAREFCCPKAEAEVMLKDVLQSHPRDGDVVLAFGPEGGWTDEELKLFHEAGWISASLGSTILRAETAAIAGLAVALSTASVSECNMWRGRPRPRCLPDMYSLAGESARATPSVQKYPQPSLICSCPVAVAKPIPAVRAFEPDERQREAIEHLHGPMLVIAGAGTGKTTVLTRRIARLVRDGHARPDEILAVTYTKNAAQEMRQRVRDELRGTDVSGLQIATFHEYCNDLLGR